MEPIKQQKQEPVTPEQAQEKLTTLASTLAPTIEPETQAGTEVESPKCQIMLENRMQCPRHATKVSPIGTAVCLVHWQLLGSPESYKAVERKAGV